MSRIYGGAATDRSNYGSAASLDNVDPLTVAFWLYPTTLSTGRAILNKRDPAADRFLAETHFSTASRLLVSYRWSGGNDESDTATGFLVVNTWHYIIITYDSARAGNRVRIYKGDVSTKIAEASYSFNVNASSGTHDDSAASFIVGNNYLFNAPIQGRIANIAVWNVVLTTTEMEQQKLNIWEPATRVNNCVLFSNPGWWSDRDKSGANNHATVTGTTIGPHPPIGPLRSGNRVFTVAAVGRTTKNTDTHPLGIHTAMSWRIPTTI